MSPSTPVATEGGHRADEGDHLIIHVMDLVDARVPRDVEHRPETLARTQHRRESEVVREALEEYLARH